ncbi:hypothetical protein [Zobellia russellii]|uniref:hypothetical protein n=1 Tax=Zobellia russellii TaxID=248907 RepID=UPI001BFFB3C6|nr:hypothetical protein [Zobellia russellii]MBT9187921.1 hypothetical protein [Zobellia russellii]
MTKSLIILFSFICFYGSSQNRNGPQNSMFANNLDFFALQKVDDVYFNSNNNNVSGSPYLFNDWKKVRIEAKFKQNFTYSILANYNISTDNFIIKLEDQEYILNPESVISIKFDNRTFKVNTSFDKNYHEVLADGSSIDLIRLFKVTTLESPTQTLGLVETKIKLKSDEFLVDSTNQITKLPKSKNKIYESLKIDKKNRAKYKQYNVKNLNELSKLISEI